MRARPLAIVAVALLLAACGGRAAPEQPGPQAQASDGSGEAPLTEMPTPGSTATPSEGGAAAQAEAQGAAPGAEPDGPPPSPPPMDLSVEVAHPCVSPGSPQVMTIRTVPGAGITMVIGYADHDTHGHRAAAFTDERGEYVWRVVLPHDVGTGTANVLVSGVAPEPEEGQELARSGRASAQFEVREVGRCPVTG